MATVGHIEKRMHKLATALFFVVGLINLLPVVGVLGAERLHSLYGVTIAEADILLLMRHRAVLFALVGGLLMVAACKPSLRLVASVLGFGSMLTFLMLALPLPEHGPAVHRVFWTDIVACGLLAVALWASRSEVPRDR